MNPIKDYKIKEACFKVASEFVLQRLNHLKARTLNYDNISHEIYTLAVVLSKEGRRREYWKLPSFEEENNDNT